MGSEMCIRDRYNSVGATYANWSAAKHVYPRKIVIPPPSRRRTTPPPPRVRFCKNKYNSYLVRVSIGMIFCHSTGFGYSRMVWTAVVSSAISPRTVFNARRCTSFSSNNIDFITELCFPNCGHWHFGCQSYSTCTFVVLHYPLTSA